MPLIIIVKPPPKAVEIYAVEVAEARYQCQLAEQRCNIAGA